MLLTDRPNRGIFWSKEGLHTVYGALSQKYYTANCSTDYSVKIYYKRSLFFFLIWILCKNYLPRIYC